MYAAGDGTVLPRESTLVINGPLRQPPLAPEATQPPPPPQAAAAGPGPARWITQQYLDLTRAFHHPEFLAKHTAPGKRAAA